MFTLSSVTISALGLACLAAAAPASDHSGGSIQWFPCSDASYPKIVECGQLKVPMDYKNPHRPEQVTLSMVRVKARGPHVFGNLHINPGGPGASAIIEVVAHAHLVANDTSANGVFSPEVSNRYNIIGVDPRGIGRSNATRCDPDAYNKRVPNHFTTKKEYDALLAYNKNLGKSCRDLTGPLLDFVDTVSVVRDMDRVRAALGDKKLDYFGFSYGTQIGTQYAEVFPHRVGRMVLDGVVDHSQSEVSSMMAESATYEATLNQFFAWCAESDRCALHGHNAPALFDELITRANAHPIPAPDCEDPKLECRTDASGWELLSSVQGYLTSAYGKTVPGEDWEKLSQAINATLAGDASGLAASFATAKDSPPYASFSVGCLDWRHEEDDSSFAALLAKQIAVTALSPHTRGVSQSWDYQSRCVGWPTKTINPQRRFDKKKMAQAPPMLMANSLYDPETSVAWAVGVKVQIPQAVLVFRNGSGHTSYDHFGETQKAMDRFLIDGKLPKDDTVYKT